MILTEHKKRAQERKQYVWDAYSDNLKKKETGDKEQYVPVSILVSNMSRKFKVSMVQIYSDIKSMKTASPNQQLNGK